jgi:phage protein U
MLCQLGAVQFTVVHQLEETSHDGTATFAEHPVVGRQPTLEFMGEGSEPFTIRGKLFPKALGGAPELSALQAMRKAGQAQFYMRGDGVPIGWVVIEKVTERASYIASDGTGRVIEFDVALKKASGPSADGIFNALLSLFS